MKNIRYILVVLCLLMTMFGLMYYSSKHDSLTFDEKAHIAAGFTYLEKQDYRVNPEHPPLAKDISALGLMGKDINFPEDDAMFTGDNIEWWRQFNLGNNIIYEVNGDRAEEIIQASRFPMILLTILLGLLLFFTAYKWFGKYTALLTLFFYSFSPTFIAHGRLVTIDIIAAFGMVLATYFWISYLKNNSWKNVLLASIAFGIAMISKFSLILLIPYFIVITLVYAINEKKNVGEYIWKSLVIGILGLVLVVAPVYSWHLSGEPIEKQIWDVRETIGGNPIPVARDIVFFMMDNSILRPIGYWSFGVLMAGQRTVWGNTTYFMGQVASNGWAEYFPTLYLYKVPLGFHILTLFSLLLLLGYKWKLLFSKDKNKYSQSIRENFYAFSMGIWLVIYWGVAILGNLNIGLRHIIPAFPFTFMLVAYACVILVRKFKVFKYVLGVMLIWQMVSVFSVFPYYISYFNEMIGIDNGHKITADSNYDWGQDLYELKDFVEENKIEKFKIHYFGGEDLNYHFGDKWEMLDEKAGKQLGWIFVSLTELEGRRAIPVRNYDLPTDQYMWLNDYTPIARAGKSIMIYNIIK